MSSCAFCRIGAGEVDAELVAYRRDGVFVLPALRQRARNRGHVLVAPVAHAIDLAGTAPALRRSVFDVVAEVSAAVRHAFGAVGSTVFQNNSVPDQVLAHLHVHVVPRFAGDDFRMPDPTGAVLDHATRAAQAAALARALASPNAGHPAR